MGRVSDTFWHMSLKYIIFGINVLYGKGFWYWVGTLTVNMFSVGLWQIFLHWQVHDICIFSKITHLNHSFNTFKYRKFLYLNSTPNDKTVIQELTSKNNSSIHITTWPFFYFKLCTFYRISAAVTLMPRQLSQSGKIRDSCVTLR